MFEDPSVDDDPEPGPFDLDEFETDHGLGAGPGSDRAVPDGDRAEPEDLRGTPATADPGELDPASDDFASDDDFAFDDDFASDEFDPALAPPPGYRRPD